MPEVCRLGDICTGHGDWPPRPNVEGDDHLMINGLPVHCEGHRWAVHCNTQPQCHDSVLAAGSSFLEVNGRRVGRVGDPVACGSVVATGDGYLIIDD